MILKSESCWMLVDVTVLILGVIFRGILNMSTVKVIKTMVVIHPAMSVAFDACCLLSALCVSLNV